jgi:hypothetical protein
MADLSTVITPPQSIRTVSLAEERTRCAGWAPAVEVEIKSRSLRLR